MLLCIHTHIHLVNRPSAARYFLQDSFSESVFLQLPGTLSFPYGRDESEKQGYREIYAETGAANKPPVYACLTFRFISSVSK